MAVGVRIAVNQAQSTKVPGTDAEHEKQSDEEQLDLHGMVMHQGDFSIGDLKEGTHPALRDRCRCETAGSE